METHNGSSSDQLLEGLQQTFGCKRRAAQDALTVLVRGGWLERREDEHDARRKHYFLTQEGRDDLGTVCGQSEMRFARWRHSTTSTRARRLRRREPDLVTLDFILDAMRKGQDIWPGLTPRKPGPYIKTLLGDR